MVAVSAISSSITRVEFLNVVGGVQHEAAARLDRAAEMDRHVAGRGLLLDPDLLEQILEAQAVDQPVDHQPHGAVDRMRAEIDHAAREARIGHLGHRNQQLPGERALGDQRTRALSHSSTLRPYDIRQQEAGGCSLPRD